MAVHYTDRETSRRLPRYTERTTMPTPAAIKNLKPTVSPSPLFGCKSESTPKPTMETIHPTRFMRRYFWTTLMRMPLMRAKGDRTNAMGKVSMLYRTGDAPLQAWKNTGM